MILTVLFTFLWLIIISLLLCPIYFFLKNELIVFWGKVDLKVLLMGIFALNILLIVYVMREKAIFTWDFKGYWALSIEMTDVYYKNPFKALKHLYISVNWYDYNVLPTVFLLPFIQIFGKSRLVYELSLLNIYWIPSVLSSLFFFNAFVFEINKKTLSVSLFILLFCPIVLLAIFLGYIDVVGILFFFLLLCFFFKAAKEPFKISNALALFFVTIFIIFLRRWFGVFVQALVLPAIVFVGMNTYEIKTKDELIKWIKYIGLLLLCILPVLIIFKVFFMRVLGVQHSDVYSAYSSGSVWLNIETLAEQVGYFFVAVVTVGIVNIFFTDCSKLKAIFIVMLLALLIVLFSRIQSFNHHHKLLLFVPFSVLVIAMVDNLLKIRYKFIPYLIVLPFLLSFKFMSPVQTFYPRFEFKPQVNPYYDVISNINDYFKGLHLNKPCVMVLVSSLDFNDETLRSVGFPHDSGATNLYLLAKHVDKKDGLPFELFTNSRFVVVTEKTLTHLHEDDQWVIAKFNKWIYDGPFRGKYKLLKEFKHPDCGNIFILEQIQPYTKKDFQFVETEFSKKYKNYSNLCKIPY